MRISDKIDTRSLERREAQLSLLAIFVIAVMSVGMALAMYPLVFAHPVTPETETARRAFYGFCVLSALMVIYLTNRHIVIRRLRGKLREGQARIESIRRQAAADLLRTLPGISRFQDRLAMEIRRCTHTGDRLSLLLILSHPTKPFAVEGETENAYGEVVRALLVKLRKEDAIYAYQPGAFGVVMVAPNAAALTMVNDRLIQSLEDVRVASGQFTFETKTIAYPEEAKSAWELEQSMRAFLKMDQAAKTAEVAGAVRS